MWIFPLAAAVISVVFAAMLGRQWMRRRRPSQALWTVALAMYAVASLALTLGVIRGWTGPSYRLYWLLGAVLNVPFLAAGEAYLLIRLRAVTSALLGLLLVATAYATWVVATAAVQSAAELTNDLPTGKGVWGPGSLALHLAQYYAYPTYAFLIAGTLWSAWKMRGRRELRDRFFGTLGIAVGATVAAAGAAFAATGMLAGFSVTLAAGVAAMFWGFLRASRPAPAAS